MFEILPEAEAAGGAVDRASKGTRQGRFTDNQTAPEASVHSSRGRRNAARGVGPENADAPIEALKRVVRGYLDLARRLPACGPLLFSDQDLDRAEDESGSGSASAFETIVGHVRAAQQAGELKSGDPEHITVLILGAIVGAVDLAQSGRVTAANAVRDLEALPLHLIDRLAVKRAN